MKKDVRLNIESQLEEDLAYYSIKEKPISIYGVWGFEEGIYRRLPKKLCEDVVEEFGNTGLNQAELTSGVRVRFSTDSEYIAIYVNMPRIDFKCHVPLTCTASCDLYEDFENGSSRLLFCYGAQTDVKDHTEMIRHLSDRNLKEKKTRYFTVYLPAFASVSDMYIGVEPDAKFGEGLKYKEGDPIVVYGSSIVNGICADRPGNVYSSIITRNLNRDVINLGFNGSARGEKLLAEYIANMKMSAFVYDYDHNAPTYEELRNTHERFYKIIREKNPTLPIIFMSRPIFRNEDIEMLKRRELIYSNFMRAKERGENVWFIDGESLFGFDGRDDATTDFVHPNAFGYYMMAKGVSYFLRNYCNL